MQEELRYERKFLIREHTAKEVEQLIKFHPACFSEIFHERSINNIYFDTPGFNNYYDNIEGEKNRLKVRIRWYGSLTGKIETPVLEMKIKKGLLGTKKHYPLKAFHLDTNFSKEQIMAAALSADLPLHVKHLLESLQPALLNRYSRKYFMSADKKFRITIDKELTYYRISYNCNTLLNSSLDHQTTILELKYDADMEGEAKEVGSQLPFALTKSSKYLQGLERTVF